MVNRVGNDLEQRSKHLPFVGRLVVLEKFMAVFATKPLFNIVKIVGECF